MVLLTFLSYTGKVIIIRIYKRLLKVPYYSKFPSPMFSKNNVSNQSLNSTEIKKSNHCAPLSRKSLLAGSSENVPFGMSQRESISPQARKKMPSQVFVPLSKTSSLLPCFCPLPSKWQVQQIRFSAGS